MKFPVFDFHCDTALLLLGKDRNTLGRLDKNELHIDLERAATVPGYAQCFACFTTPLEKDIAPVELFERELATVMREVENNCDLISLAYSADDILCNYQNGKMSAVLSIEGPAGFDFDPELQEAVTQIPAPSEELKGKVVDCIQKGYTLYDKVIRYPKVVVGE